MKNIELKAIEVKKLVEGLLEIQGMALTGYQNKKDNQGEIATKVINLLRLLNSKMVSEEPEYNPKKFIYKYNIQEEPQIELKTILVGEENQRFLCWEELYELIKPYEVDGWKYWSQDICNVTNRYSITFIRCKE